VIMQDGDPQLLTIPRGRALAVAAYLLRERWDSQAVDGGEAV